MHSEQDQSRPRLAHVRISPVLGDMLDLPLGALDHVLQEERHDAVLQHADIAAVGLNLELFVAGGVDFELYDTGDWSGNERGKGGGLNMDMPSTSSSHRYVGPDRRREGP